MTQLLSQLTPSHPTPPPATISHDPSTDTVMTTISRFDAPKRKRRAKAFALALLPLALALTACGGGSSDDPSPNPPPASSGGSGGSGGSGASGGGGGGASGGGGGGASGGTPPVTGNYTDPGNGTSPGGGTDSGTGIGYETYSGILEDLADSTIPIYEVLSNGWSFNPFPRMTALVELKKFYDNTINGAPGIQLNASQLAEYEDLISKVYRLAETRYTSKLTGILSDLRDYPVDNIITAIGTQGDAIPHTSTYIRDTISSTSTGSSQVTTENILLGKLGIPTGTDLALRSKYSTVDNTDPNNPASNDEFGSFDLRTLKTYTAGSTILDRRKELMNMLVGFVNPSSKRPAAQLSFYHANTNDGTVGTSGHSVGADLMHMKDVSFFLYYYADTSSDPTSNLERSARVKGTPSMSKYEFMKELNDKGNIDTWRVSGTVDGTGGTNLYSSALPASGTGHGDLTYRGYMLAGTVTSDSARRAIGVQTYMGDAEIILDHTMGANNASTYNVDVTFSNILPTDGTGGTPGMIKFMNQDLRAVTGDTTDSTFGTAATDANGGGILGRFYGTRSVDNDLADNYGGRDAVGGTFTSTLGEWDGDDQEKGKDQGQIYYGVFGAQQTTP